MREPIKESALIVAFGTSAATWHDISDPVMGGISSSEMVAEDGVGVFKGVVSLEHSGGFASVRSAEGHYDLSGRAAARGAPSSRRSSPDHRSARRRRPSRGP